MQFIGEYQHALDAKKRLLVPSYFREAFQESCILSQAPEGCLFLHTPEGWENAIAPLVEGETTSINDRRMQRKILRGTTRLNIDKQGRITIPESFSEYAGLKKDVVVFGAIKRIEIWDAETFEKNFDQDMPEEIPGLNY